MKAFTKGSYRSPSSCSYCRSPDHQITNCPIVEDDWAEISHGRMPLHSNVPTWYKAGKHWGEWYQKAQRGAVKIADARERANNKRPTTTRARKCGFCGEHGHTRKDCQHMKSFIKQCEKANENWRRAAYSWLVDNGLYVGSAIKIKERAWGEDKPEQIGLITTINLDELNVMTAFNLGGYSGPVANYRQPIKVIANVAGSSVTVGIGGIVGPRTPIAKRAADVYTRHEYVSKMTTAAAPLDESWVTSYKAAWTWLAKKRSHEWLQDAGIVQHITDWASKTQ